MSNSILKEKVATFIEIPTNSAGGLYQDVPGQYDEPRTWTLADD